MCMPAPFIHDNSEGCFYAFYAVKSKGGVPQKIWKILKGSEEIICSSGVEFDKFFIVFGY